MARASFGEDPGRTLLARVENQLAEALGQEPVSKLDVANDGNIELVATLLEDLRADRDHACPMTPVLPPGVFEDSLRWLGTWPEPGPAEGFAVVGLAPDAEWTAVVATPSARFKDHGAAGVAYHHWLERTVGGPRRLVLDVVRDPARRTAMGMRSWRDGTGGDDYLRHGAAGLGR